MTSTTDTIFPEPDAIVVVPFYCEARFAPALQRDGAELLRRLTATRSDTEASYAPPFKSTDGDKDAWKVPEWANPDDLPAARWLLSDLPTNQRRVLARLIAAGEPGTTTGTALGFAGYSTETSAAPVFKAIGGRFRRVGLMPLWRGGDQTATGQTLPVPDGPARDLFVEVLRTEHPELAAELGL